MCVTTDLQTQQPRTGLTISWVGTLAGARLPGSSGLGWLLPIAGGFRGSWAVLLLGDQLAVGWGHVVSRPRVVPHPPGSPGLVHVVEAGLPNTVAVSLPTVLAGSKPAGFQGERRTGSQRDGAYSLISRGVDAGASLQPSFQKITPFPVGLGCPAGEDTTEMYLLTLLEAEVQDQDPAALVSGEASLPDRRQLPSRRVLAGPLSVCAPREERWPCRSLYL